LEASPTLTISDAQLINQNVLQCGARQDFLHGAEPYWCMMKYYFVIYLVEIVMYTKTFDSKPMK